MKTPDQVKEHIEAVIAQIGKEKDPKKRVKLKKRLGFLIECREYLSTNPREQYITKEASKLRERAKKIRGEYKELYPKVNNASHRRWYEKLHDLKKGDDYLKTIEYLLETN